MIQHNAAALTPQQEVQDVLALALAVAFDAQQHSFLRGAASTSEFRQFEFAHSLHPALVLELHLPHRWFCLCLFGGVVLAGLAEGILVVGEEGRLLGDCGEDVDGGLRVGGEGEEIDGFAVGEDVGFGVTLGATSEDVDRLGQYLRSGDLQTDWLITLTRGGRDRLFLFWLVIDSWSKILFLEEFAAAGCFLLPKSQLTFSCSCISCRIGISDSLITKLQSHSPHSYFFPPKPQIATPAPRRPPPRPPLSLQQLSWMQQSGPEPSPARIRRINDQKDSYKRSTNNSHKKFICMARRLLFKHCAPSERERFETQFEAHRNSRSYFFILLAHAKLRLPPHKTKEFRSAFAQLLSDKVELYQKEIRQADNKNFVNFRYDEIADLQYAMKAFELYFDDQVEQAIETIYKKEKVTVLKKQQHQNALTAVLTLEQKLRSSPSGPLFPYARGSGTRRREESGSESMEDSEFSAPWEKPQLRKGKQRRIEAKPDTQQPSEKYQEVDEEDAVHSQPLLFLEKSFPLYSHFFHTIYPYESDLNYQPHPTNPYYTLPLLHYIPDQPPKVTVQPQRPAVADKPKLMPVARTADSEEEVEI